MHTIELPCIADTYVDSENPSTNFGSVNLIEVGSKGIQIGASGYLYRKIALLKFNGAALPPNKRILVVKLKLYVTDKYSGEYSIYPRTRIINRDFVENEITYELDSSGGYSGTTTSQGLSIMTTNQYNELPCTTNLSAFFHYRIYISETLSSYPWNFYFKFQSREGANPPILVITYEDVPPSKPTLNEPIGSFKVNTDIISFSWNYISSVGGTQKGFVLQWSTDQETWTTVSQTTSNTHYDMPADTLPAGNVYWRVKTINEYDEESEYSDVAAFYAIGAPETPVIQSVNNVARPTVTWTATDQQVYQIQITDGSNIIYDSGLTPGILIRGHKIPIYLQPGDYEARVRIKNEYDLFSEWGALTFSLDYEMPNKPGLTARRIENGIELTITNASDSSLIYRDGICIGETFGDKFNDYSAASGVEYEYFVRTVDETEAFADSDTVKATALLKGSLFAPVSDLSAIVKLKYNLNDIPGRVTDITPVGSQTYLSGRTHPITEFTEHESHSMSFQFFVRIYSEVESVMSLIRRKETVLYRDGKGRKVYGVITGCNIADDRMGYLLSFSLTTVDYSEEVS